MWKQTNKQIQGEETIQGRKLYEEIRYITQFEYYFYRYGIVLPWFVFYMSDIPSLNSTSVFGFTMSNKIMTYLLGLQVALGSSQNFIMAMSALVCKLGLANKDLRLF